MMAALGGLDALVFTGGIGEHSAIIRERVCDDASWVGIELDAKANERGQGQISTRNSKVQVFAIPTNEDLIIAKHTLALLGGYQANDKSASRSANSIKIRKEESI